MNRASLAMSFALAALIARSSIAGGDSEKKEADLKWAKGVASDFLNAAFAGDVEQAESLLDHTLRDSFAKQGEHRLREWLNNSIAIQRFREPSIRSEQIAPDRDEVSLRGTFKGEKSAYEFSLRVLKNKDNGAWRVSFFRFQQRGE